MKINLVQPNVDVQYANLREGYGDVEARPPETGLAVLHTLIKHYARAACEVTIHSNGNLFKS